MVSFLCCIFAITSKERFIFKTKKHMKKTSTLLGILTLLGLCMVFTSCSKDEKIAIRISGEWEGDWGMSYVDKNGYNHDSHYTAIKFYPNEKFDTEGYGYQEDYYDEGPFKKLGYYFEWRVDKKILYINYPGYPEYNAYIHDYKLKKKHFTGYFGNSNTSFDLIKLEKYYKWYDYAGRYAAAGAAFLLWVAADDFYYYDDYYPTGRATGADMPNDSISDVLPIKIYNRFAE